MSRLRSRRTGGLPASDRDHHRAADAPALLAEPVPAGFPSPADDVIEEEDDLQRLLIIDRPATFLVRVAGDSMVGARLFDGGLAVVDRWLDPRADDVAAVDVGGDSSFKAWGRQGGRVTLAFLAGDALVEVWGVASSSVSPQRRAARR